MTSLTPEQRKLLSDSFNALLPIAKLAIGELMMTADRAGEVLAIVNRADAALALLDSLEQPKTDTSYPVPVSGQARTTDALKRWHWHCLCCDVTREPPLTDETTCQCADIYDQAWVRVDGPLPPPPTKEASQP